jgi:hypothetical protein
LSDGIDDQIAIGHQQRILPLIALTRPDEGFDEAVPDRRAAVDGDVRGGLQFRGALLDEGTLLGIDATGVGEDGVHGPAAFLQPGDAEAGVEAAGEGEDDGFFVGHESAGMKVGCGCSDVFRSVIPA